nr:phosphatidylinositol-3-phosphatase myotubularin-1 isoform X1 [Ipomoea batatas]
MYRSRSARSASFHDPGTRFAESERIEGAGSWDALEWTKIEPISRSVSQGIKKFLLPAEQVIVEGNGIVLVNTDEAGTLFVTNFRLLFLSEGSRDIIALGTISLTTIEKFNKMVMKLPSASRHSDKNPSRRLLQVIGISLHGVSF